VAAEPVTTTFSYAEMVQRNLGFVSAAEQERLRRTPVFCCGTGGMGGAALQTLVRAGCGRLVIADLDRFEVSNLNRQVFAGMGVMGQPKAEVTARALREIDPELELRVLGREWTRELDALLGEIKLVVNAMDDTAAALHLYRRARVHGATVVDAYSSPLPSVFVVRPADPRPEERLGFPTLGTEWERITDAQRDACRRAEALHVLVHSSSARHFDLGVAGEVFAGRRPRPSFAPVVIMAGNLMAAELLKLVLGRSGVTDDRGYFFNPWTAKVERPRSALAAFAVRRLVRAKLEALTRAR